MTSMVWRIPCLAVFLCEAVCSSGNGYPFPKRDVWRNHHPDRYHDEGSFYPDGIMDYDDSRRDQFGMNRGFEWNNGRHAEQFNNFNSPPTTERVTTSTVAQPGMGTTRSPCENRCQATTQYDPICGDNGITYTNMQWFHCARRCGRSVQVRFRAACPRTG